MEPLASPGHLQANIDEVLNHSKRVVVALNGSTLPNEKRACAKCHYMMVRA
jgi:hypothetical protein